MGKIEEAIKQTQFKDVYNKAVVNLLYTHSYLVGFQTAVLKPQDLSPEQYNVLRILRGQQGKPATIAAIQERMVITEKGLRLLELLEPQIATINKKVIHLEESELDLLNGLLDKLRG